MEISSSEREGKNLIALKPSLMNKDVIQSYILTTAKYNFSIYQKRILYRIVEYFQALLQGKKLDKNFSIEHDSSGLPLISMPISCFRPNVKDKHYIHQIKMALMDLQREIIQYETKERWESISLLAFPVILHYSRIVQFRLHPKVYEFVMDFSKGYRKYELETAMSFRSVYSMRFYELLSGQKHPLTYSIANIKAMFRLENKYKNVGVFISRVIEQAQKELDLKSPYSFTYELEYEEERKQHVGRKKITGITFIPVYRSENRNSILEYKDLCRTVVLSDVLLPEEQHFFVSLGFTEQELKK
ncbi:replication initiation protein [Candidatus Azobacteroides pseudotrichonymphae]|uniref:replication initiation protein n=1 Tax=Candidatus Azobacteroides pseudotrichonymphae TaxID=511435 RepID=UPI0003141FDD|nr:replication initiation protein [Candidatus Azobacteroides pseudotrichonymphae]